MTATGTGEDREAAGRRIPLWPASGLLLVASLTMLPLSGSGDVRELVLRTFAVLVLAFLPGWLFARFVLVRRRSVWDEFVLNLHRLGMDRPGHLPEPPVNSIYHATWVDEGGPDHAHEPNIYRDKFEAYYGRLTKQESSDGAQPRTETYFPVFLATAVFGAGWAAVLANRPLTGLRAADAAALGTADMLCLGFAGAYLFTLQMLVRRYFQADLRASAYVNAVTRVVSALVLVLVVDLSLLSGVSQGTRVGVAFTIGFFPLVGLQALQKMAALVLRTVVPTLRNDYPLSDLDGLSVWYEARLLELGIEDMENLATANLVDVILHSRVPVARLVDWVDQAHLYLHLEPRDSEPAVSRRILRSLGVRTATSLEEVCSPVRRAGGLVSAEDNRALLDAMRDVLNRQGGPSVVMAMLKAFQNDPNLEHVRRWKQRWSQTTERPGHRPASVPFQGARAGALVPAPAGTNGNGSH